MSLSKGNRYIIPPGLRECVYDLHALLESSAGKPLLIFGPTGVGKTIFSHMCREWYLKKGINKDKVVTVNCSLFDNDLMRSELFGHVKGAFTDAKFDKTGLIQLCDGGVLILDEMGELSTECQAKLLTVIEDGNFHRIGETEISHVNNLKIIGTTNKSNVDLRLDFRNRFLSFTIPPLSVRRSDVFYYMAARNLDLVKNLHPWEILAILAYNWPGNVREIERVVKSIETMRIKEKINEKICGLNIEKEPDQLFLLRGDNTGLTPQFIHILGSSFADRGHDIGSLEQLLNYFGISIDLSNNNKWQHDFDDTFLFSEGEKNALPMNDFSIDNYIKNNDDNIGAHYYNNLFNIEMINDVPDFVQAKEGYDILCELLWNNRAFWDPSEQDMYTILPDVSYNLKFIPEEYHQLYRKVEKDLFEYISMMKLSENEIIPIDAKERYKFFSEIIMRSPTRDKFSMFREVVSSKLAKRELHKLDAIIHSALGDDSFEEQRSKYSQTTSDRLISWPDDMPPREKFLDEHEREYMKELTSRVNNGKLSTKEAYELASSKPTYDRLVNKHNLR